MYRPDEAMNRTPAVRPTPDPIPPMEAADAGGPPTQRRVVGRVRRWDGELFLDFTVPDDATGTDIAAAAWRALVVESRRGPGWIIEIQEPAFQVDTDAFPAHLRYELAGHCRGCGMALALAVSGHERIRGACPGCGRQELFGVGLSGWTVVGRTEISAPEEGEDGAA